VKRPYVRSNAKLNLALNPNILKKEAYWPTIEHSDITGRTFGLNIERSDITGRAFSLNIVHSSKRESNVWCLDINPLRTEISTKPHSDMIYGPNMIFS
jgi:hypothetical protein